MDEPMNVNEINEEAELNASGVLPEKSADVYLRSYQKFMDWKKNQNINEKCISESVMLMYFENIKAYNPSSMLVEHSMLKTVIAKKHNVDIEYPKLITFLETNSIGFQQKTSHIFQPNDIRKFLSVADDMNFLAMKVIMIFGVSGITHTDELIKIEVNDVREDGNAFNINIPETITNVVRPIIVEDEYAAIMRKYIKLRPPIVDHNRFFITFLNGQCTPQPIERNEFFSTPKHIANFLNLEEADNYTGLSFRRTSLKHPCTGQSSNVADCYIDKSNSNKRKTKHLLTDQTPSKKHTSSASVEISAPTPDTLRLLQSNSAPKLTSFINNMQNNNWSNVTTKQGENLTRSIHSLANEANTVEKLFSGMHDKNCATVTFKEKKASKLVSKKTADACLRSYEKFMEWKKERNINEKNISESVMLMYFKNIKGKYKPSSMQSEYSMLKRAIANKHNVKVKYPKLITLLKNHSDGFQPKKTYVFQPEDIQKFLSDADDVNYLVLKVIIIFGVNGATNPFELIKVDVNDVRQMGNVFVIKFPKTKSNVVHKFTVKDDYASIIRKYIKLRPRNTGHTRFFINFQKGKFTPLPIGSSQFLNAPKQIASFLNLGDSDRYTSQSFRCASNILLSKSGDDQISSKKYAGSTASIELSARNTFTAGTSTLTSLSKSNTTRAIHSVGNEANIVEKMYGSVKDFTIKQEEDENTTSAIHSAVNEANSGEELVGGMQDDNNCTTMNVTIKQEGEVNITHILTVHSVATEANIAEKMVDRVEVVNNWQTITIKEEIDHTMNSITNEANTPKIEGIGCMLVSNCENVTIKQEKTE